MLDINYKDARGDELDKLREELKKLRSQNAEFRKIIAQQAAQLKRVDAEKGPQNSEQESVKKEACRETKQKADKRKRKRSNDKASEEPASNRRKLVTAESLLNALISRSPSPAKSPKIDTPKVVSASPEKSPRKQTRKARLVKKERTKSVKPITTGKRRAKAKLCSLENIPEQEKLPYNPTGGSVSPNNLKEKPSAVRMVEQTDEDFASLPKVELQTVKDGFCPLCGLEYCDCSDDELDFGVSADESPREFNCEMCTYSTSNEQYYLNHIHNCDYSGQKATMTKVSKQEKNETQRDEIPVGRYKQVMCKHFLTFGKCQYGKNCTFRHGEGDMGGMVNQQQFPIIQTPMINRVPVMYPQGQMLNAPSIENNKQFILIPRQGQEHGNEPLFPGPGVVFLSNIHPKTTDKILLGALRHHLGGERVEFRNHVQICNGCAVVCFKRAELAGQLLNSLPFQVFHQDVEISREGVPTMSAPAIQHPVPPVMQHPVPLQNWVNNPSFGSVNPNIHPGVVIVSGMKPNINNKYLLGALRRHFGGSRIEVTNHIEVTNGIAVVRFKDPAMVSKLMGSLPLKIFDDFVDVRIPQPGEVINEYNMETPQWNGGFHVLPASTDRRFNNLGAINRYNSM